jgi:hypothetical protein
VGLVLKLSPGRTLVFRLADGREVRVLYEERRGNEVRFLIDAAQDVKVRRERGMKSWVEFCNDLGARESAGSGNYRAKNKFGFLGRYQFGLARLCDFGLTTRKPGMKGASNDCFAWVAPFNEEKFLSTPSLQDACFEVHVSDLRDRIKKRYSDISGLVFAPPGGEEVPFTLSGAVGVAHLLGLGGLSQLADGVDKADANGTRASSYLKLFNGYELPADLISAADFGRRYKVNPPVASV